MTRDKIRKEVKYFKFALVTFVVMLALFAFHIFFSQEQHIEYLTEPNNVSFTDDNNYGII